MRNIFLTQFGNYRIIWRFILFIAVFAALIFPLQYGLGIFLESSLSRGNLSSAIVVGSIVFTIYTQVHFFDKSSFKKYGLKINKKWMSEFWFGCFIAAIQLSLFFAILYYTNNLTIIDTYVSSSEKHSFISGFTSEIFRQLSVSVFEEILNRSFLFFIIYEMLRSFKLNKKSSIVGAVLFNSILFGLLHLGNDNASYLSTFNLAMDSLTIFLPFILTGRLGMSIGMHFSWNFIQSAVLGFANSGTIAKGSLLKIDVSNNPITGGAFGTEGSSLMLLLSVIAIGLVYFWKRKHKMNYWIKQELYDYGNHGKIN